MGKERKRIVIVGASSGFGLALAKLYMESGWIVGLAARRTEPLERLKSQLPSRVSYARLDVMEPEAPEVLRGLIEHMVEWMSICMSQVYCSMREMETLPQAAELRRPMPPVLRE